MQKIWRLSFLPLFVFCFFVYSGHLFAAPGELVAKYEVSLTEDGYKNPEAQITVRKDFKAGETIFFDAASSVNYYSDSVFSYWWDFGDGSTATGKSLQHVYREAGNYRVVLRVSQNITVPNITTGGNKIVELSSEIVQPVTAYQAMSVLLHDATVDQKSLDNLLQQARAQFFHFAEVGTNSEQTVMETEDLVRSLSDNLSILREAEIIFVWTDPVVGLNALTKFAQNYPQDLDFSQKKIVIISDYNLGTVSRIAQGAVLSLHPQSMIFARPSAIYEAPVAQGKAAEFVAILAEQGYEFSQIETENFNIPPWDYFSYLLGQMISHGISQENILYLLILPVILALIVFLCQVIGFSTGGVVLPVVVITSWLFMGLSSGLVATLIVLFGSLFIQIVLRRQRLLYTPRIALNFSLTIIVLFFALGVAAFLSPEHATAISIFPLIILATLTEKITTLELNKKYRQILRFFGEVLFVSLVCYFAVGTWRDLHIFLLAYPESVLVFILIIFFLGRFTGLRFFEYLRFRPLLRESERREEEEE